MKKIINATARTVTFTFDGWKAKDGEVLDATLAPVTLSVDSASEANQTYAMLHGFAARVGDNAAIAKTEENGFRVTEGMRRAEVEAMIKFYENAANADWNMRVAAATKVTFNPAIQALAAKLGKGYDEALAWYNAKLMAELDSVA
jgi:hypothetical protein